MLTAVAELLASFSTNTHLQLPGVAVGVVLALQAPVRLASLVAISKITQIQTSLQAGVLACQTVTAVTAIQLPVAARVVLKVLAVNLVQCQHGAEPTWQAAKAVFLAHLAEEMAEIHHVPSHTLFQM